MSEVRSAIILRSELNPWIDFCIIPSPYEDFGKVQAIAEEAYYDWFDKDTDEPIGNYIQRKLDEGLCNYDMYYLMNEEM